MAAVVVTYGTTSFGSARYRASPPSHIRIRVMVRASRLRCAGPRPGFREDGRDSNIPRTTNQYYETNDVNLLVLEWVFGINNCIGSKSCCTISPSSTPKSPPPRPRLSRKMVRARRHRSPCAAPTPGPGCAAGRHMLDVIERPSRSRR